MISDIPLIEFSEATFAAIMAHARRSYPDECCGALLGREKTRRKAVESIIEIDNGTRRRTGDEGSAWRRAIIFAPSGRRIAAA
jgi:proteasome lid subunit RPN8/RPN11